MATDTTGRAARALSALEEMAAKRADWNHKGQPLNPWVGYQGHNSHIAWKVFADHIQVFQLGPARAEVMKSRERFLIRQKTSHAAIPEEDQEKVVRFLKQLPRLDYAAALAEATRLTRDPGISKYLFLEAEQPKQHAPQRFPTTKTEVRTLDGELLATSQQFRLIIRGRNDVTYRNAVPGDLAVALAWVRDNQTHIARMKGHDILKELREAGFKGDYS